MKLKYKYALGETYYCVINNEIHKVGFNSVKLSTNNEPIYNGQWLESTVFKNERYARRFILKKTSQIIKMIDKTK